MPVFVQKHSEEDFVLWNGNRALIKRSSSRNIWTVR